MIKQILKIFAIFLLSAVFTSALTFAQSERKEQGSDHPAGWEKGNKKGWDSDVPPGQMKEKKSFKSEGANEEVESKAKKIAI